jgi:hypothetical protein
MHQGNWLVDSRTINSKDPHSTNSMDNSSSSSVDAEEEEAQEAVMDTKTDEGRSRKTSRSTDISFQLAHPGY